ncbi:Growth factor receptor cysteine-rich domain [Trinorchestia longiramus]|nr:Growth factor receptor cysteine-rich domain [Trinorchestia longiramus]
MIQVCDSSYKLHRDECVHDCPDGYFASLVSIKILNSTSMVGVKAGVTLAPGVQSPSVSSTTDSCVKCHFSCKRCSEKLASACTLCWADASYYPKNEKGGVCYSRSVEAAYSNSQAWSGGGVFLVVVASLALVVSVLGFVCVRCFSGTSTNGSNNANAFISDGVDRLRELKDSLHKNGAKKSGGGGGAGADYRKLSEDTHRLVTSSKPFYDYPSSDEEDQII